jgi:hypothetical protein
MRKIAVLVMSTSLMITAIAAPSQALVTKAKVTKPSAPTIVSVTSTKPKNGNVNVTVKIALPSKNGGSKITGSKVTYAGKSCTMKNTKTTCTIKGISEGYFGKVVATSKNTKGFGAKSKRIGHTAGSVQLRFNIKNAAGVALSSSNRAFNGTRFATNSTPKLLATNTVGQVSNAVSSGSAPISKFLIAPNGNLFVLFQFKTDVNGVQCLLAEVVKTTGLPTCIDGSLDWITWDQDQRYKPIQFDSAGAIYYMGQTYSGSSNKTVLRKYQAGQTSDLINDFIWIQHFVVVPNGGVVVSGQTSSTQASWIRYIPPSGKLSTLSTQSAMNLDVYADGNVYFGSSGQSGSMIRQFNVATESLNPQPWIGNSLSQNLVSVNDISQICAYSPFEPNPYPSFCNGSGSQSKSIHNTIGGKTFMIAGYGGNGLLAQVFPTVSIPTISVKKIAKATTLGGGVVVTGLDASDLHKTIYFNAESGTETTLIPTSSEIEIYHMTYNAATNKMMFDGLRFADNKYVFGQVDLGTNQVNIFSTLTTKWDDFQGFQ